MLAEFLQKVALLANDAQRVQVLTVPELPDAVFVRNGSELTEHPRTPPRRAHKLVGFDDLVAAVNDPDIAPAPEVYLSRSKVIVLLDAKRRTETVTVNLPMSQRFQMLMELERPTLFEPKAAVKLLRYDLHGGNVEHVIQALSRVDFIRTSAGHTNVAHGKESLGRSVEAAVQQADQVPTRFTITVAPWNAPGFNRYACNIEMGLHLDLEAQKVELRVLADEAARVINLALAVAAVDLRKALDDGDKVPVFLGEP